MYISSFVYNLKEYFANIFFFIAQLFLLFYINVSGETIEANPF